MLIGELAAAVGVNPKTVRYYESIGLLPEPTRTAAGYRDYEPEDVDRLAFVRRAVELDLQLDEIAEILTLRDRDQRPCDYVLDVARHHLDDLDRRIAQMQHARQELHVLLERANDLPNDDAGYCPLIEHHPADQEIQESGIKVES